MWRRTLVLGALALSVLCPPSFATERNDPVTLKLVGAIPVAERGRALRATFELTAQGTVEISDLKVEGAGWSGRLSPGRAERFALTKAAPSRLDIEATPADPTERLVVSWTVDGRRYRSAYDLSPATAKARREGGTLVAAPPGIAVQRGGPISPAYAPGPVGLKFDGPIGTVEPQLSPVAPPLRPGAVRMIHVTGQFVYQRQSGTWPWLGGDYLTVQVIEKDFGGSGSDIELGRGMTDPLGNFDVQVAWVEGLEAQPDLYVLIVAANVSSHLERQGGGSPYFWVTGTTWDFPGTQLDIGGLRPNAEGDFAQVHVYSDIQRANRWYFANLGIALPYVTLRYPVFGERVSYHSISDESINIIDGDEWREVTHAHEYGHHFMHVSLPYFSPSYCNLGVCDADWVNGDCGHCAWCPEANTPTTPWNEALCYFLGTVQCDEYEATYGFTPGELGTYRSISTCSDPDAPGLAPDANFCEGMIAALLYDIYDSEDDDDPHGFTNGKDTLSLGWQPVMNAILAWPAISLSSFVGSFYVQYPQHRERFWRTAANNRYDFDTAAPAPPANFHSISHAGGVASGDATPTFQWTRATDDASGVVGYSIRIGATAAMPDEVVEAGDVTTWTSAHLAPGHYQVTIRSLDRANKWSTTYSAWGELVIRESTPANLTWYEYPGWDYPVVPRSTDDATFLNVNAPTLTLPGNTAGTYWNASMKNVGESSTELNWLLRTWLDGVPGASVACTPTAAGGIKLALNQGPVTVRGGRHTFSARADDDEEISEIVETDNEWAKQWIWTPYTLASGTGVTRAAPPDRTGGWEDLPTSSGAYYNCDGIRVTNSASNNWRVLWLRVDDPLTDYDVRMHSAATGAEEGFAGNLAYSRRPEGCLDAVLYNHFHTPEALYFDVGVLNTSGGSADYYAKLVTASPVDIGDSVSISFPAGEMLRLRQFDLAAADTGWYWAKLSILSGTGPVYLAWYDDSGDNVALADETYLDTAINSRMPARLDLHLGTAGSYALAIYRDPKDGTAALSVRLEFERMAPDYVPAQLAGWYSPFVPRPESDGTPASVPLPDTLYGDVAHTFLNFAVGNASYGDQATNVHNHLCVDGVSTWGANVLPPNPLDETIYNGEVYRTVPGGRHLLSLCIDPEGAIQETDTENNGWGEQWVFGPSVLATTLTRAAPPEMTGGWDEATNTPFGLWYNCDGLRVAKWSPSGHHNYWGGFAVMPGDTSDVDVRLHEAGSGARSGFSSSLIRSLAGAGALDYVLVNFNQAAFRAFDLGVLRVDGAQAYTAQLANSVYRGTLPDATYGPFTLGPSWMLHLHEVFLDTGVWDVTLTNTAGAVNWGLSAHNGGVAYHNLSTVMPGGIAWQAGPGAGETMRVRVDSPNYQLIAVWKAGSADLPLLGTYTLDVHPSPVDVPEGAAARTAFAAAWPNPFARTATVAFELARESDVRLEIYDLGGARVRTLADGRWPAGRHEVRWDAGAGERPVSPGIYFVRFAADGVVTSRRVVKLE